MHGCHWYAGWLSAAASPTDLLAVIDNTVSDMRKDT